MNTTTHITVCDIVEVSGHEYLAMSGIEDQVIFLRNRTSGKVIVQAWSEHYANGFFRCSEATHEELARVRFGDCISRGRRDDDSSTWLVPVELAEALAAELVELRDSGESWDPHRYAAEALERDYDAEVTLILAEEDDEDSEG